MRCRIVALGCATAVLAASPASAGWEYSDWGMTPAEVVAASDGTVATTEHDPGNVLFDFHQLARGEAKYMGITMQVNFYFDPDRSSLQMIDILPQSGKCDLALNRAQEAFGEQDADVSDLWLADDLPMMRQGSRIWEHPETGDEVEFYEAKTLEGKTLLCKFLFSPDGPPED